MIWEFRPEVFPLSTSSNAATLRALLSAAGVTLTRSSAATVQTSASTVVTAGIGVDDPRVGNAGYGPGLVVEESRVNYDPYGRGASWGGSAGSFATQTYPYGVGPDGNALSWRHQVASGGFSRYMSASTSVLSPPYTSSLWLRSPDGGGALVNQIDYWDVSGHRVAAPTTEAWARYSRSLLSGANSGGLLAPSDGRDWLATGGIAAGARDVVSDMHQFEAGKFATEFIPTGGGASATRGADSLSLDTWNRLVRGGRIAMEWIFIPKASAANASNSMWLLGDMEGSGAFSLWIAFTVANTISFKYRSGGTPTSIAAAVPTWNPGDSVRVFAEFGNGTTYAAISINGGAKTVIGLAATVFDAILPGSFSNPNPRLMNYQNTAHMNCWLQRIRAFNPGRRPAWAA